MRGCDGLSDSAAGRVSRYPSSVALEWVVRGHRFSQQEWRAALRAFDLLREAAVVTHTRGAAVLGGLLPPIEEPYADRFIRSLLDAEDVTRAGVAGWAEVAGRIPAILREAGLFPAQQPAARLLVAYCLYWWYAFAYGYMFEIEVLRDLGRAGWNFRRTTSSAVRSGFRDTILKCWGSVVTSSAAWLSCKPPRPASSAILLHRAVDSGRSERTLVVMMRQPMWNKIDGDTILTTVEAAGGDAASRSPNPYRRRGSHRRRLRTLEAPVRRRQVK